MYRLYMTVKQANLLRTACASMIKLYNGDMDAILEDVATAYSVSQAATLTIREKLPETYFNIEQPAMSLAADDIQLEIKSMRPVNLATPFDAPRERFRFMAEFSDSSRYSLRQLLDDYSHIMLGKFSRISDILLTDNTQCCKVQQGLQQLRSCLVPSLDLSVASTDACWQAKLSYEMVKVLEENRRSSKPTMIRVTKEPLMLVETI